MKKRLLIALIVAGYVAVNLVCMVVLCSIVAVVFWYVLPSLPTVVGCLFSFAVGVGLVVVYQLLLDTIFVPFNKLHQRIGGGRC